MHKAFNDSIKGYYIAAYACPTGAGREEYAPFFKLFVRKPENYFDECGCLLKGRPNVLTNDARWALHLAFTHARHQVSKLPQSRELLSARYGPRLRKAAALAGLAYYEVDPTVPAALVA